MVQLKTSHDGITVIAERDGAPLCSLRDPRKEAIGWALRWKELYDYPALVVVGLGAAHHLRALSEQHPDQLIQVVYDGNDYLDNSIQILRSGLSSQVKFTSIQSAADLREISFDGPILLYRPACSMIELEYFKMICGQDTTTLKMQAEKLGFYSLANSLNQVPIGVAYNFASLKKLSLAPKSREAELVDLLSEVVR